MTDFRSVSPYKSKLRACSRYVASLVANAVGDAIQWYYMFSQLGIQLWPMHSVSSGDYHCSDNLRKLQVTQSAVEEIDIVGTLRDWFKRQTSKLHILRIIGILTVAYRMRSYNVIDRWHIQSKQNWLQDAALRNTRCTVAYRRTSSSNTNTEYDPQQRTATSLEHNQWYQNAT